MSTKISQLPAAVSIANTAVFPLVQNATTEKATLAQIAAAIGAGSSGNAIIQLIGDVTTGTGGGVQITNIANSGVTAGSYSLANITVDRRGIVTSAENGSLPNSGVTAGVYGLANITVNAEGIVTSAANGFVTLPNSGVTAGVYGLANITVNAEGIVTSAANGFVTLPNSGVTAGSYINANITVDAQGFVTSAANGIIPTTPAILVTSFISLNPGPFVKSHTLGAQPRAVTFTMTSNAQLGQFWLNTANVALGFDSANVYGIASDSNVAGQIIIFA